MEAILTVRVAFVFYGVNFNEVDLNKQEHINYWLLSAKKNLKTVENLFKAKDYVPALFFMHLHLEKLCKALWVKNNTGNHPPRIHNLVSLLNSSKINFSDTQLDLMLIMNNFQLEGRYPDYKHKLYGTYKRKNTEEILKQAKTFSKWLQKQLSAE